MLPLSIANLQKRLERGKPLAPLSWPSRCSSAAAIPRGLLLAQMGGETGLSEGRRRERSGWARRALVAALTCEPVDLTMNVEEGLRPVLLGDDEWAAWLAAPRKVSGELN